MLKFRKSTRSWIESQHLIEGWMSPTSGFLSVLLGQVQVDQGYRGNIAEIGVYHGKYLTGIGTTAREDEKIIAIDLFDDQTANEDLLGYNEVGSVGIHSLSMLPLQQNLEKFCAGADKVIIKKSSLDLTLEELVADGLKIRFFSIDGGHTMKVFLNDLRLAESALTPEGLIVIDDILSSEWPGIVTGAVRYFDGETDLRPVAFMPNKLVCAFQPMVMEYRRKLAENAAFALRRKDVEFSDFVCDQYAETDEWRRLLPS